MATEIKSRRGTEAQHDDGSGFTGAEGELTVDTTNDTVRVHDGSTKGGHRLAKYTEVQASNELSEMLDVNLTSPADGSVLKYDNASSKWIDSSKLTETATGIDVTGTVTADALTIGSGNGQMDITADANNTYITQTTTTGNIYLDANNFVVRDQADQSYRLNIGDSDGVKLYSNNAQRVLVGTNTEGVQFKTGAYGSEVLRAEIKDAGLDVTGTVTADGVTLGNNEKITFGAESDGKLEIYESTGGNGFIEQTGNGNLSIKGQDITLSNNTNQTLIKTLLNTAQLFHRNGDNEGLKLETTNTGIDVTGTVTADGVTLDDNQKLKLGGDASPNLEIFETAVGDGYIGQQGAGNLVIQGHALQIKDDDGNLRFQGTNGSLGNAFLYYGADTTPKLNTVPDGIEVTGTVTTDLVKLNPTGGASEGGQIEFQRAVDNQTAWYVDAHGSGTDTSLRFVDNDDTNNPVTRVSMNNTGINVTGTIDCDTSLQIQSSGSSVDAMPDLYMTNIETAADAQNLGMISFRGYNDASTPTIEGYANIYAQQVDVSDGAEKGKLVLQARNGAGYVEALEVNKDGIDVTGTVEADAFSGTGNTSITDFVTDVSTNDNDTTVPTTAAVKSYVDNNDGDTTYTGGTGLTLDGTTFNVDASQTQITSVGTLTGLTTGATTVNGPLIATNDYHQFRSTNTNNNSMPLIEVFRDKEITAAGSNPLGGFVFTGLNEDDRKVSYGSFSCNSTFQYDDGEHKAALVFTVADGSGAVDPFTDYTNASYKSGHSVALNIGADFFITNGYIRSDSGELKLGSKQSIKDSAEAFNDQGTYDLHMPNATKAKVISIGGIGPFDLFITGNQTAAQMIRYRGQHMLMVAGGALEFDLPACAASADISETTCNVGDIFQISNAAGGALTIDTDGSGTAQTVYHFPSGTLSPFANNPTLAVGGTMMLQAVAANTWMIFNPTGLTDA